MPLAASDAGLELLANHRDALLGWFRLDDSNSEAQLRMLDKLCTYEAAVAAGVPTPRFWRIRPDNVETFRRRFSIRSCVEPLHSEAFVARFGRKYFLAMSFDEVVAGVHAAAEAALTSS